MQIIIKDDRKIIPTDHVASFPIGYYQHSINTGSKCMSKCRSCKRVWGELDTARAHYYSDNYGKQNYICDTCHNKMQSDEAC